MHVRLFVILVALLAGCAEAPGPEPEPEPQPEVLDVVELGQRYVGDRAFRRQVLVDSLVDPLNGYSALRLARYATTDPHSWDGLPELNPPVRPVTVDDIGAFADDPMRRSRPDEGALEPVFDRETFEWTEAALLELGREAFERYPLQVDLHAGAMTHDATLAEQVGLWRDDRGHLGGLVRIDLGDGTEAFSKTCTTCHARPDQPGGALVHGATNPDFDHGAIDHLELTRAGVEPERVATLLEWGPGQVDVTGDGVLNPTAITDLRPIRHQTRLHWAGTVRNGLVELAVRIETLIITSHGEHRRPPREVAFALAVYLWSLGEPAPELAADLSLPGAETFTRECSGCHQLDGTAIEPVPVSAVGTDPAVATSPSRGLSPAVYRVPSLWQVADRRQLLHHGAVHTLDELLDPARLERVPGHPFGTALSPDERAELIEFLGTIGR